MSEERYEIREKIGQGGVGAVYHAYDTQLNREVAIKRVLAEGGFEDQEGATRQLIKEAAALSAVQHPHIVTVYDTGIDDDGPYVVMELINGLTLDEMVERGTLTWADFKEIALQSQEALIAAQDLNLLHRDLKPTNIMVCWLASGKFQVKLVDFGLAKFSAQPSLQTIDHGDAVFGSIFFMAPEQFERTPLDKYTDMYAMGCLYYYSLTGVYPFSGETAPEVMASHLQNRVQPLQELRPDIPAWACEWVMWHLARDIHARPQSAREALEKFLVEDKNNSLTQSVDTQTAGINPATGLITPAGSQTGAVKLNTNTASVTAQSSLTPPGASAATSPHSKAATQPMQPAIPAGPKFTPASAPEAIADTGDDDEVEIAFPVQQKKPISAAAKWALIGTLSLLAVILSILLVHFKKQSNENKQFNKIMQAVSSPAVTEIELEESDVNILLKTIASQDANSDRNAILKSLYLAKPANNSFNVDIMISNFATSAIMPDGTRTELFRAVLGGRANEDIIGPMLQYAKDADPDREPAAAAVGAAQRAAVQNEATVYFSDFLNLINNSESSAIRSTAESACAALLKLSNNRELSTYRNQIKASYQNALSQDVKLTALRLLGTAGGKASADLLSDLIADGTDTDKMAAIVALEQWNDDSQFMTLIDTVENSSNPRLRKQAFDSSLKFLRSTFERRKDFENQDMWQNLADTAQTPEEKMAIIRALASQRPKWGLPIIRPFTTDRNDKVSDYAERAVERFN
ncbi:serine/threonine-protein kinase [Persicirhabdus sediminis]|uniref:Protein kinase n=1 Tax=Persicirhabdus sediminis TaxID=454144 RepID=A0A8J7MDB4_9BACT|nr:serine/threonine-protein kinase [Persicirhabdus sediminis]MBK1790475.1 protein kinase [Persicirhabdus sediminis]